MSTLREDIDTMLAEWSVEYLKNRRRELYKNRLNASGELIDDWKRVKALVKSDLKYVASVIVEFGEYGRFLDMKRVTHSPWNTKSPTGARSGKWKEPSKKAPFVENLEKWADKKGDKLIAKYLALHPSRAKAPRNQLLNRIAWGIVKTKQGQGKHRRRRWYFKGSGATFESLRRGIAEVFAKHNIKDIKEALEKNI